MANDDITAVVVAFNSAEILPACLAAASAAALSTVVVDNASADENRSACRKRWRARVA